MEILRVENLIFRYPEADKNAIENVSLTVKSGEFSVIFGQSGCGKSTLLRLLKKELSPYGEISGEIFYNGTLLADTDSRTLASDIGFVLQDPDSQIVTDTVWHELAFGLESLGYDTQSIRRRVAEMASYFGIEGWYHKKTDELSGGQKQLLNLASVMVMQPEILLLDEPTAQLDPIAASNFISTLQKLNRELGLTVILAEHRLEEVFPIADRVLLMEDGKLMLADDPRKVQLEAEHPMSAALPAAMRIYGSLETEGDSPLTVRECRGYITQNYNNIIDTVTPSACTHDGKKAVELRDVWFRYGKALPDVMRSVSFTVYEGEHFCILGGNGTGKSTTLNVIGGVLVPYRGKVKLNGKTALLPQNPQTLFLENTVRHDLVGDDAYDIARKLGITHLLDKHPYDLSGGEQQKAAVAKLLLANPRVLLLDEPTKGIDAHSKKTLADIINTLKNDGVTVITVTHDVEFAAQYADRCGLFFDGELLSTDTPDAFFSGNSFYTTAASRISRGFFKNAVLCEQVVTLCEQNGKKGGEQK